MNEKVEKPDALIDFLNNIEKTEPMTEEEAVIAFIAKGAKPFKNLEILSATTSIVEKTSKTGELIKQCQVWLSFDKPVPVMQANENKVFEPVLKYTIPISEMTMLSLFKRVRPFANFISEFKEDKEKYGKYLPGCKVNIMCTPVLAGSTYVNYFMNKENTVDNTTFIYEPYHLVIDEETKTRLNNKLNAI